MTGGASSGNILEISDASQRPGAGDPSLLARWTSSTRRDAERALLVWFVATVPSVFDSFCEKLGRVQYRVFNRDRLLPIFVLSS